MFGISNTGISVGSLHHLVWGDLVCFYSFGGKITSWAIHINLEQHEFFFLKGLETRKARMDHKTNNPSTPCAKIDLSCYPPALGIAIKLGGIFIFVQCTTGTITIYSYIICILYIYCCILVWFPVTVFCTKWPFWSPWLHPKLVGEPQPLQVWAACPVLWDSTPWRPTHGHWRVTTQVPSQFETEVR